MGEILHVYPTQLRAEQASGEGFAMAGSNVLLSGCISSITQFENTLLAELPAQRPIGDIGRWLILREAVSSQKLFKKNSLLSDLSHSDGFIPAIGDLIQQIKLGLLKNADMASINGFAPGKEDWIKSIFRRYNDGLRKNALADSADLRTTLAEKLADMKSVPHAVARFDEIHFHDIFHFTPFRFELVRRLGQMKKVVIHFQFPDDRRKVFDFLEREIQKFQSLGEDAGKIELSFSEEAAKREDDISIFAKTLFDDSKTEPVESDLHGNVEILINSSRYREIEEVAQRILQFRVERKWSDFCLVFRGLEKYGAIVEDVFRRAEIPLYLKRGIPVRANPYVKTLLGIFRLIETDFDRDELVKLATSQYFSFLPKNMPPHELENAITSGGITGGAPAYWKKKIDALKKKKKIASGIAVALEKILKLLTAVEKFSKTVRASACMDEFQSIINLLSPRELKISDRFSIRDSFCRSRFETVMGEIKSGVKSGYLRKTVFGWRELKNLLLNALGNIHTPEWSNRNHVYALTISELAGLKFPFIFVCGLHDGEFPRRAETGSILTEQEKKEFNNRHAEKLFVRTPQLRNGRRLFSRLGESWEEESFLFYLAVRCAKVKLFLSYSTRELNGEELSRSSFLEEVSAVFPKLKTTRTPALALGKEYYEQIDGPARETKLLYELFHKPAEEAGGLRDYFLNFINSKNSGSAFRIACEKSRMELGRLKFYSEFNLDERARSSGCFTGKIGPAGSRALSAFFGKIAKRIYSPSALADYANCPFRYFMSRLLRCEPLKLPGAEIERSVQGTIVHEILERYYIPLEADFKQPAPPPRERALENIRKCAHAVFEKWEKTGESSDEKLWEITKQQILALLELFVESEERSFAKEPFSVIETEFEFGTKQSPAVLSAGGEKIRLAGKIDRVDYLPQKNLLRVIDYKHTASISKYSRLLKPDNYFTESFQMPIYLFGVMANSFKNRKWGKPRGACAAYYSLKKEPKLSRGPKMPAPFDEVSDIKQLDKIAGSDDFGKKLLTQINKMESGDFSVTPTNCTFCQYRRVCRYQEVRKMDADE